MLKADYDGVTARELVKIVRGWRTVFVFYWPIFGQFKFHSADVRKSPSGRGFHVEVVVENAVPEWLVPFVQSWLGSHREREILNLTRILTPELNDGHEWNVLYRRKYRFVPDGLELVGEEKPQPRLTKQVTRIIEGFTRTKTR